MMEEPNVLWCGNDEPHDSHTQRNQFGGTDYCSGRPDPAEVKRISDEMDRLAATATPTTHDDLLQALAQAGRMTVELPDLQQRPRDPFAAERAFRDQMDADFRDGKIAIVNGWLVEVVNEHTCAGGGAEVGGAHESGCGMSPLMDLWAAHRERNPRG